MRSRSLNYIGLYALVALASWCSPASPGRPPSARPPSPASRPYAAAVLATRFGLGPLVTLPAALLATVVAAFLIAAITLRLSGHYLPLSTIAWGISLFYLFGNIELLGGHTGIDHIPPLSLFGMN